MSHCGGGPPTFQTMSAPGPPSLSAALAPQLPPPRSISMPNFMAARCNAEHGEAGACFVATGVTCGAFSAAAGTWDVGDDLELELETGLLQDFV